MTKLLDPKNADHIWIGPNFAPVEHDGYGICYLFGGEDTICI